MIIKEKKTTRINVRFAE